MKTIYPNFKNQSTNLNIIRQLDNERIEILEDDRVQIDNYEEGCGVALLTWEEYEDWNFPILTHEHFDPISDFKETENHYNFYVGGYNYSISKNGEPIFYQLNKE